MCQYWYLSTPKISQHHPCYFWLHFELPFDREMQIISFHTLLLVLQITVVEPCFFPSNKASQKVVTFVFFMIQKVLADTQVLVLVLFYKVLGKPSCTNFMKA
jgi:hypothetical protein